MVALLPDHCPDAPRRAFDQRFGARWVTWTLLAAAGVLMLLSLPVFPTLFQAIGNNLAATALIGAGLIWHMRHPPASAPDATLLVDAPLLADAKSERRRRENAMKEAAPTEAA